MMQISFDYKNNSVLSVPPLKATYGDDIQISLKQHDKYGVAVNYSSEVLTLLFSNKTDNSLLFSVTGAKLTNSGTFLFDTSSLPSAGEYKLQFLNTSTNESVYAVGTLKLNSLIE